MIEVPPQNGSNRELDETDVAPQYARLYVVDTEVSPQILENARKNEATILRYFRKETATAVAQGLGMSDSSLSRWINSGPMGLAALILARLGLKVVPVDAIVYLKPEEFN